MRCRSDLLWPQWPQGAAWPNSAPSGHRRDHPGMSALVTANGFDTDLAARLGAGRLHLLAYGLGASAFGMTFYDSEIAILLREPVAGLLITCVGVPEYTARPGGLPGAPTAVRIVAPHV